MIARKCTQITPYEPISGDSTGDQGAGVRRSVPLVVVYTLGGFEKITASMVSRLLGLLATLTKLA